ncbi:MAG: AAA family ATPase [Hydrococcus sp. RM1_1_31]|nr:AAA family ATPase [Hydrococcus sp. RM1_1_31]
MATIRLMEQGKGAVDRIANNGEVEKYLEGQKLTQGQREAIALAATTTDQFIAWQGKAGAGKTYALNEFREIAQKQGYTVKGYAPSASSAKVLADEVGIETTTVARKLVSQPLEEEAIQQQIWIVDEAGLLGAKNALTLLERATAENARVLLVGDTRQFSSVEAGNPFKSLQQAGITTAYLNQSLRQKTQDLKQAVEHLSSGEIQQGVGILEANHRIEEIQEFEQRTNRIVQDYLNLSPSEREQNSCSSRNQ